MKWEEMTALTNQLTINLPVSKKRIIIVNLIFSVTNHGLM